jgi:hypothetical protein
MRHADKARTGRRPVEERVRESAPAGAAKSPLRAASSPWARPLAVAARVLPLAAGFTLLRLPSLIEPTWYADEGTYADIGRALDHGAVLYRDVWDNKPPGIYWLAALTTSAGASAFVLHLALALLVALSTLLVWALGRRLGGSRVGALAAGIFAVLASLPNLDGDILNSEIAALPLTLGAMLLVVLGSPVRPRSALMAGALLGAALLFKAVLIADVAEVLSAPLWLNLAARRKPAAADLQVLAWLLAGAAWLLGCVAAVLALGGSLSGLIDVVTRQDVTYVQWANGFGVGVNSAASGAALGSLPLLAGSRLGAVLLLGAGLAVWAARRRCGGAAVVAWWLGCDLATVMLSARGFTHYVQQAEGPLALAVAMAGVWALGARPAAGRWLAAGASGLVLSLALCELVLWLPRAEVATALGSPLPAPELHNFRAAQLPGYYARSWERLTGSLPDQAYFASFPGHVERKLAVISLFMNHSRPGQRVFVWGAMPWVYAVSDRLPAGRYVTLNSAYYLDPGAEGKLLQDLANHPPAVLVVDHPPPPELWLLLHHLH